MKLLISLLVLKGSVLLAFAQGVTNSATAPTNTLSIYLLAGRVPDEQLRNHTATVESVKLATKALLADPDFVACDVSSDTFVITPRAAIRLGIATFGDRVPYVLVAEGRRIYLGFFNTYLSSSAGTGLPGTFPDMVLADCFMGADNIPEEVMATLHTRDRLVADAVLALAKTRPTTNVVVTIPTLGDKRVTAAINKLLKGKRQ